MKRPFLFPILALLFLTTTRLSCPEECESFVDVPVRVSDLSTTLLDNRKKEPVLLMPGAQGFLQAYGFRVLMEITWVDTLNMQGGCANEYLDPRISECRIFSPMPLPGTSSLDVSDLFRYVDRSGNVPKYVTLPESASQIMREWDSSRNPRFDFLLVAPPANEGWYQFELRLIMQDSSIVSTVTDSIYLK